MQNIPNTLAEAIARTIAWCDGLEIPPTVTEVWRWLVNWQGKPPSLVEVANAIAQDPWLAERIESHGAYVTLSGRGELWDVREDRRVWAMSKWLRALRAARIIRLVPFVRLVAVTNTLAWDGTTSESDIDLFIASRANRLWTTRFFITILLQCLGLRRHGTKIRDRICLGFWVDETALDLAPLTLKPDDPYFAFWLATMWPLYGQNHYRRLLVANIVLCSFFPLSSPIEPISARCVSEHGWWRIIPWICELLLGGRSGDWLEHLLYLVQKRRIYHHRDSAIHAGGTAVVVTPHIAKFHEVDRRVQFYRVWLDHCRNFGIISAPGS